MSKLNLFSGIKVYSELRVVQVRCIECDIKDTFPIENKIKESAYGLGFVLSPVGWLCKVCAYGLYGYIDFMKGGNT